MNMNTSILHLRKEFNTNQWRWRLSRHTWPYLEASNSSNKAQALIKISSDGLLESVEIKTTGSYSYLTQRILNDPYFYLDLDLYSNNMIGSGEKLFITMKSNESLDVGLIVDVKRIPLTITRTGKIILEQTLYPIITSEVKLSVRMEIIMTFIAIQCTNRTVPTKFWLRIKV